MLMVILRRSIEYAIASREDHVSKIEEIRISVGIE